MSKIVQATQEEGELREAYIKNIYSKDVPPPLPPTEEELSFWRIAGIEAVLFTVAGLGVVVFSAIRTGGFFYIMENLLLEHYSLNPILSQGFSLLSMISSLLAFELYVVADGFAKGRSNKDLVLSNKGLFASLFIIVGAGIFTGFGLLASLPESVQNWFYIILAVGTAIAGGIVALYTGENIGFAFSKVERRKKELVYEHRKAYAEWRESSISAYNASNYVYGSSESRKLEKKLEKRSKEEEAEVKEEYLSKLHMNIENFKGNYNRLPTVSELVKAGISEKLAEEALREYMVDNGSV